MRLRLLPVIVAAFLAAFSFQAQAQRINYAAISSSQPSIVANFGASPDGVTDAYPAFAAAVTAGGNINVPVGAYRLSQTLVISGGVTFNGQDAYFGNTQAGAHFVCDLAVTPCVRINGGVGNQPSNLRNIYVTRAAGSVPANSRGIEITSAYNVLLENVGSYRSFDCFYLLSDGVTGLGYHLTNLFTGVCSGNHMVVDSVPEVYLSGGRFGMNGAGDVSANSYIKITGGSDTPSAGIGPNTVMVSGVQFNQGQNTVSYFMDFVSVLGGGSNALIFRVTGSYIEAVATAIVHSDATTAKINKLGFANTVFNDPSAKVTALNAATAPSEWEIVGSEFFCTDFTLAPTAAIDAVTIGNSKINCATSITGATGSVMLMTGITFNGNLTVAGAWNLFDCSKCAFVSGSVTNTATGPVLVPGAWKSWTPSLFCGSGTITTQSNTGKYRWLDAKTVAFQATYTTATIGTCATSIFSSLPTTSANSATGVIGRESANTGKGVQASINGTSMALFYVDNTLPIQNGNAITLGGVYEVNAP